MTTKTIKSKNVEANNGKNSFMNKQQTVLLNSKGQFVMLKEIEPKVFLVMRPNEIGAEKEYRTLQAIGRTLEELVTEYENLGFKRGVV